MDDSSDYTINESTRIGYEFNLKLSQLRQQARNEAKESPSSMPPKIYILISIGGLAAILLIYILIYEVRKQRKSKRNQPENIVDGQNENLII